MEESEGSFCSDCGAERASISMLQKQIRQLTEKLGHSQRINELLAIKCEQMHQRLREAAFKGRSSISVFRVPSLPNEILRNIFSLATEFEGLAFARWSEMDEANWDRSSATRRAIPMVCRQWHMIGIEFLFGHLALRTKTQLGGLLGTLGGLNPTFQNILIGYVDALEFDVRHEMDGAVTFKELALRLIDKIPNGQLRRFGVDCGRCDGERTSSVSYILFKGLKKAGGRLKILHLPCMDPPEVASSPQADSDTGGNDLRQIVLSSNLPLQTLSLMGGYWNRCNKSIFASGRLGFLPTLGINARLITTLFLNCTSFSAQSSEDTLLLLDNVVQIDTLHIVPIGLPGLNDILEKIPLLKRLFITLGSRTALTGSAVFAHSILEEITIISTTKWNSENASSFIKRITTQIKSNGYPSLKQITMHGFFPNGCVDPDYLLSSNESERWIAIIDCLGRNGIVFVNQQGQSIHIWCQRHGVTWDEDHVGHSDSSSNGEEWYETSDENGYNPPISSGDSYISDDSDDFPYRYAPQRDLQLVYSEEDEEVEDDEDE